MVKKEYTPICLEFYIQNINNFNGLSLYPKLSYK